MNANLHKRFWSSVSLTVAVVFLGLLVSAVLGIVYPPYAQGTALKLRYALLGREMLASGGAVAGSMMVVFFSVFRDKMRLLALGAFVTMLAVLSSMYGAFTNAGFATQAGAAVAFGVIFGVGICLYCIIDRMEQSQ